MAFRSSPFLPLASLLASVACSETERLDVVDATQGEDVRSARLDAGFVDAATVDSGSTDAAVSDSGSIDSGAFDSGDLDASVVDTGPRDSGVPDVGSPDSGIVCHFDRTGDAERPRIVLVGHPYDANANRGHEIRSMTLTSAGNLVDNGMRLDVGARVQRLELVPSGELALALGEEGELISLAVNGTTVSVLDMITLPSADFGELHISSDGRTAWIVGLNVAETSGISVVRIGCDGSLLEDPSQFLNIRLAESMAFLPGRQRAVLLGGQAVFDPVDPKDLRMIELNAQGGFHEISNADIFMDTVSAGRIAVSPDGLTAMIPNGSLFSNEASQVLVAGISGTTISERARVLNLEGPSEALFSVDGRVVLVSRPEANRVSVLRDPGTGWALATEIAGIGLVDQLVMISRGSLSGLVLAPSTDVDGTSNIAILKIDSNGAVRDLGQFNFGDGFEQIPEAIAVMQ